LPSLTSVLQTWVNAFDVFLKNPLRERSISQEGAAFSRKLFVKKKNEIKAVLTHDDLERFKEMISEMKELISQAEREKRQEITNACWRKYHEICADLLQFCKVAYVAEALKDIDKQVAK
jgi:hypothetical protein